MDSADAVRAQTVSTFLDFVKRLAEISVLLGALLFLVGWSYLYGYYSGFGLSSDDLGLSPYQVLVHCVPVVLGTGFLVTVPIAFAALLVIGYLSKTTWMLREFAFIFSVAIVALFATSRYATALGRDYAVRDSFVSTTRLPYVTLEGPDDGGAGCSFGESNYRLLLRSNGHVFVVLPVDDSVGSSAPNLRVCSFPDSRVQALRIQVGLRER